MKTLETDFSSKGFRYRQLSRDGDVAVFEQTWGECGSTAFVTVIVQRHNGREIAGVKIPPAEFMPSSSTWGIKGWTFTNRDKAFEKAITVSQNLKSAVP